MYRINNLLKLMQYQHLYPVQLIVSVDEHGLLLGKVINDEATIILSRKQQFIEEVLENLDEEAGIFIDKSVIE
jgi:hypothetical protein